MNSSNPPFVSFVVPCYNYGRYLPDCLNSIFGQTADYPFEIIAVDDCSTDNTREILAAVNDPRLRIILHERNQGHLRTIPEGLLAAKGKYVARIDPDDRYRPCFLSETVSRLEQYPEVGFVYGDAALIGDQGELQVDRSDHVHEGRDYKGNELVRLLIENIVCAPTVIARRECWLESLPLPEGLAFSDWYFNLMIARRHEFYYVSKTLADYRVHGANHHSRIVLDKTEEASVFHVLEKIFGEAECGQALEKQKRAARGEVYGRQYLTLASKYFGAGMFADARRCYWKVIRHAPQSGLSSTQLRRLAATYLRPETYASIKRAIRRPA